MNNYNKYDKYGLSESQKKIYNYKIKYKYEKYKPPLSKLISQHDIDLIIEEILKNYNAKDILKNLSDVEIQKYLRKKKLENLKKSQI